MRACQGNGQASYDCRSLGARVLNVIGSRQQLHSNIADLFQIDIGCSEAYTIT